MSDTGGTHVQSKVAILFPELDHKRGKNAVGFKVSVSVPLRGCLAFLRSWSSNKANIYHDSHLLQCPEAEQYLRRCFFEQNQ